MPLSLLIVEPEKPISGLLDGSLGLLFGVRIDLIVLLLSRRFDALDLLQGGLVHLELLLADFLDVSDSPLHGLLLLVLGRLVDGLLDRVGRFL